MPKLDDEMMVLADYFEQHYLTHANIPSKEVLVTQIGISEQLYSRCLRSTEWLDHLEAREIPIRNFLPATIGEDDTRKIRINGRGLTSSQLAVCNAMFDFADNRSDKKKLADFNVSPAQWEAWKRDPAVQSYLRARAENLLGDHQYLAHRALVERVGQGDIGAIKYYNEITGRFIPERGGAKDVDVKLILMKIMEILQQRLSDQPQLLEAIGTDLIGVGQQFQIASAGQAIISAPPVAIANTYDAVSGL